MAIRIGMILDTDFPPDSRVESEAVSLIEAGFEVYLLSITYKGLVEEEDVRGIKVRRYPANTFTHKLSALAYTFPFYHIRVRGSIRDFLQKNNIQIVHVHDMLIARAVWQVKPHDIPLVLDLHENRPAIMKSYRHVKTLKGRLLIYPEIWDKYQKKYIQEADKVIVVTKQAREEIVRGKQKVRDDVVVVPNTVHPDIFYGYSLEDSIIKRFEGHFNVLYLGDTGIRRGTDTAINAISILKEKIPDIRLILVGSNKEDYILKEMVIDQHLEENIIFDGWRDVSLFPSYIASSDICISPIKRNLHHDTTFANKVFQYMAMGKPLVVSDCPPQAELVQTEKAGLVHVADDAKDMADKILILYENNGMRSEFGHNAKEAVLKRWQWKKTSQDLIALYKSFEIKLSSNS